METAENPNLYYGDNKDVRSLLLTTLNSDSLIAKLDRNLAGIVIITDQEGEPKAVKDGKPLLNKEGRRTVIRILSRYIDKESKLSNLDKQQVERHTKAIAKLIILALANKEKEYELESGDKDEVVDMIVASANLALSRSLGAKELDHVYTDTSEQRIKQTADQKQTITGTRSRIFGGGGEEQ